MPTTYTYLDTWADGTSMNRDLRARASIIEDREIAALIALRGSP